MLLRPSVTPLLYEMENKLVRWFAIQSDANGFELCFDLRSLFGFLGSIEDHEN